MMDAGIKIHVAVLEDQNDIRMGLVKMLNDVLCALPIVPFAYASGEALLRDFAHVHPQILLVDIILDGMSGLEVIETLRANGYTDHIIIISAHGNFAYAQRAIDSSVDHYLLKPVEYRELFRMLSDITGKIIEHKHQAEQVDQMSRQYLSSLMIDYLEGGELSEDEKRMLPIPNALPCYQVAILEERASTSISAQAMQSLSEALARAFNECGMACELFSHLSQWLILVVNIPSADSRVLKALETCEMGGERRIRCGLSTVAEGICHLRTLYKQATNALEECAFRNVALCDYSSIRRQGQFFISREQSGRLLRALGEGTLADVDSLLYELLSSLDHSWPSKAEAVGVFRDLANHLHLYFKETNPGYRARFEIEPLLSAIEKSSNAFSMKTLIKDYVHTVYQLFHEQRQTDYTSYMIRFTCGYIEKNYGQKIYLLDIAHELNVSYNYLSSLFSQKMSITFSEYLQNYRLNRAASMILETTNAKVYAIAEACGFYDAQSFGRLFKQKFGLTPREYKNKRGISP